MNKLINVARPSRLKLLKIYFPAFIIPFTFFLALLAILKKAPFGANALLDCDMTNQYIYFFSYLKSVLSGENDLLYTFSKTLGGSMTGLFTYYLSSPLNLLLLLAPLRSIPLAVTYLMAVKVSLCGLCAAIYLSSDDRKSYTVLLFSTAYALMSYNIVYTSNIMWLDCVYMLPIVILGIKKLLNGASMLYYVLPLAYCLITNYYIGYMICLTSVLFFAYFTILKLKDMCGADIWRLVVKYTAASLLAGSAAAFILVPAYMSISGTKASFDTSMLGLSRVLRMGDLLNMLFQGAYENNYSLGVFPPIYCGIFSLTAFILFFLNPNTSRRTRLISVAFFVAVLLSFYINTGYVIWHGFYYPAGFYYRNAFILSFIILHFAWEGFTELDGLPTARFCVPTVLLLIMAFLGKAFESPRLRPELVAGSLAAAAAGSAMLFLRAKPKTRNTAVAALFILQFSMLFHNCVYLKSCNERMFNFNVDAYAASVNKKEEALSWLKVSDGSFYRIADVNAGLNEPVQLGYAGLSHFSSTEKASVKDFTKKLGYLVYKDAWSYYKNGSTYAADALLSVKYIMSDFELQTGGSPVYCSNDISIYENPNSLGMGFIASEAVRSSQIDGENIFKRQNDIYSAVLGRPVQIFITQENVTMTANGLDEVKQDGITKYTKQTPESETEIRYSFKTSQSMPLYLYSRTMDDELLRVSVNGKAIENCTGELNNHVLCMGSFDTGTTVEVSLKSPADEYHVDSFYFCYEDRELLAECCKEIKGKSDGAVKKIKSSILTWSGAAADDSSLLLLTIPFEKGWSATVDGEKTAIEPAFDILSAIELTPGEHNVTLRYVPPGLYLGAAISLSAIVIFAAAGLVREKAHKMKFVKSI